MHIPNFIIIGAQKAATSTLYRQLKLHHDIYLPDCSELNYFSSDYDFQRGMNFYHRYFSHVKSQTSIGDNSPSYLYSPHAAERIARCIPHVKLICSIRNPIDRAYSSFVMQLSKGSEPLKRPFEEAIRLDPRYINYGLYFDQLRAYYSLFPRNQIKVVLYDDLCENPRNFFNDICEFLGVESFSEADLCDTRANVGGLPRNHLVQGSIHKLYRLKQYLIHSPLKTLVASRMVDTFTRRLRNRISEWNRQEGQYPKLSREAREKLLPIFREGNDRLSHLIQRDLSHWNRIETLPEASVA